MKIIALDIGSSFLKSAVLDTEANTLVHKTRTPTPARLANEDAAVFPQAGDDVRLVRRGLYIAQKQDDDDDQDRDEKRKVGQ